MPKDYQKQSLEVRARALLALKNNLEIILINYLLLLILNYYYYGMRFLYYQVLRSTMRQSYY